MKIALVNTLAPFVRGGAEVLVDDLQEQLLLRNHQVTLFRLPFPDSYEVPLIEMVLASQLLDFTAYDRVIAFKFPAYCVCHPQKTLWIFHQFRQVYDLYGIEDGLDDTARNRVLRDMIREIDQKEICASKQVFVIGEEVRRRLQNYNDLPSEFIPPPLPSHDIYYSSVASDYLYYPSRVTKLKRQHLAVEAMRFVKTNVKLILTGECKEPEYEQELQKLVSRYGLEQKVQYENCWLEEKDKLKMLAECLGVLFIPYNEDYGYITLESFYSSKPMITCTDSGGPVCFLEDGYNGYLSEPTPQALAEKMDLLYLNREKAEKMGRNAKEYILRCNITWEETIRRLLT